MNKIIKFLSDIRYKIDCVIEKLYKFEKSKQGECDFEMWQRNNVKEKIWRTKHPIISFFISFYHYVVYTMPDLIIWFPKRIYWFVQRGKRGYADCDIWGFDDYLSSIIANGIKQLREELHGHPVGLTFNQWKKILKQIEEGFRMINKLDYITLSYYIDNEKVIQKTRKKNKGNCPTKSEVKKMEKAFELFKKYFSDLWD